MPRQANGNYLAPANTAAVSGQSISSTAFNTLETDIGTEITNSVDRGGRSAMTAALPMGGQKITGMADPTASTDGATKNYVDTTTAAFFSTGDVKLTLKTAADSGWLLFDDGTFGSASSGSSNSNSVNNLALFTLFFNVISDSAAPILTSGGGATTRAGQTNASTAWAANCRMSLPKTLGRALAIAGSGSGLTARALAATVGGETVNIGQTNLPNVSPAFTGSFGTVNVVSTRADIIVGTIAGTQQSGGSGQGTATGAGFGGITVGSSGGFTPAGTISALGNGTPLSIMQATVFLNAMVKQ